ncbi:type VII secretion protein EccCa [Streptomyces fulvoviolaceus]|uniref:type VII secretion protein EccCa n=1 Tax=Streptomyces fulvoviolaceus TaxID=285535 RepID=UPI0021BF6C29|nr:type VII secretion protein EccCa [Streptomyces fulvoviolaceus]MCT9084298.1 type VII secretion protein EccCa [Streptomyces fulvoviolaceus]
MVLFRRPARRRAPDMPEGELSLQEPPTLPETVPDTSAVWNYLPMGMMSASMMLLFVRMGSGSSALGYTALALMVTASGLMILGQVMRKAGDRKRRLQGERRDYLRYLRQTRFQVRGAFVQQQYALAWRHPEPGALSSLARTSRLWERRPGHDDFGEARLAVGGQRLGLRLAPMSTKPVEDLEPLSAHALRSFIRAYATVPDQPIALSLRAWSRVLFRGDEDRVRGAVRALVAQLAVFHSPDDLWLAFCVSEERRADWDWVKWLPHSLHAEEQDGAGPVRLVFSDLTGLVDLLGAEFQERPSHDPEAVPGQEEPFTVIVVDHGSVPSGHRFDGAGFRNAVVLDLSGELTWRPGRSTLRLEFDEDAGTDAGTGTGGGTGAGQGGGTVSLVRTDRNRQEQRTALGRPDRLGPAVARAVAMRLSPYRLAFGGDTAEPMSTDIELTSLLGITDLHRLDPLELWARRGPSQRLRVPIGISAEGVPVELDIKESAQGGMGPHGMLIGATGSGKSETLRTLVLALALTHSSDTLNFVLVDFKGGATFLGLDELPHTSAVITNLADEVALVSRMQDALHGELMRRQELLRAAGNYTSALEYEKARAAGAPLQPLPSLFVIVDEFSELLSAHREFMELFVMIGRLGRSLGVHLLLASQRLDEGRMHQLESHLSYRIGLRTFSAMESRGVLGVPDAYHLPSQPGSGYLKSGVEELTRFRAAYVSGPYEQRSGPVAQARAAGQVVPWTTEWVAPRPAPDAPDEPDEPDGPLPTPGEEEQSGTEQTLMAAALERLRGSGPPAHQVWLPPLDTSPSLDQLLPPLSPHPEYGLTTVGWAGRGRLSVPVGIVDRPFDQVRDLLTVDLSGAGGHVAIAGGPQSGKSTVVRTLICALALTHTPREAQFYCLDFGGGSLAGLTGLPHVGSVAARVDTERIGRTVAEVTAILEDRERLFLQHGIASMRDYRVRRAAGEFADQPHGDVFVVVDGWSTVRQDHQDLIPTFTRIAARGLNYGIHLIVTTARWVELTAAVRDQSGTRIELRMGDPIESMADSRRARSVPAAPGRGLTVDSKLHYLSALPRIDGVESAADLETGASALVQDINEHWTGPRAPQVRLLPPSLTSTELPNPQSTPEGGLRVALGLEEDKLAPAWHDFAVTPHLLVVGDTESGKTNLLRLVARAITERYTPEEARVLLVDYRRDLAEAVPPEYRLGHAVSIDALRELVSGAARAIQLRVPGQDITPARMRLADWWTGPRLFVLVDDYDMIGAGPGNNPFMPLLDHLALGYEVGLHMVVARSASGAGRGLQEALMRRLQEVNSPGLLLSCPPTEGYLFGNIKPRILPPGRALRIARRTTTLVQTARLAPPETP